MRLAAGLSPDPLGELSALPKPPAIEFGEGTDLSGPKEAREKKWLK